MTYEEFRAAYFRVHANYERRLGPGSIVIADWDFSNVERLLRTIYGREAVGNHMNRLAHELDEAREN